MTRALRPPPAGAGVRRPHPPPPAPPPPPRPPPPPPPPPATTPPPRADRRATPHPARAGCRAPLNLPREDGLTLCRDLRARSSTPVIMLTARGEPIDRIVGLEMGADDYLTKPFEPRELVARIRNVLRRTEAMPASLEPMSTGKAK